MVKSTPVSPTGHPAPDTLGGAPPVRRVSAASDAAGRLPDRQSPADPGMPALTRGFSLIGHSLTLSSGRFSLDYSWRRMEVDPSEPSRAEALAPQAAPAPHGPDGPAQAPRTAHEVARRTKLAELLCSPHASRRTLEDSGPEPAGPLASPPEACRRYVAVAQGTGRGDRCFQA